MCPPLVRCRSEGDPPGFSWRCASARRPWPTRADGACRRTRPRSDGRRDGARGARRVSSTGSAHHAHRPRPLCEGPWLRAGQPVGALDHPRHDVLQPAEHRPALPRRLCGAVPRVGRDGRTAPGAGELAHGGQQRTDASGWLSWLPMALTITVLEGDETGQELLEQALRVLESDVIGIDVELQPFDLSLETRRATDNEIVHEAARAMKEAGLGIKAATITPEGKDDVGSPNRILREEVDGKVIIRTGRRIPGRHAGRRRALPHLRRPHGGRGRLRRQAVARGRGGRRRRGRLPHREGHALDVPPGRRVRVPHRGEDARQGLRRAQVDGVPRVRGDAEGGARRGRRAPSRTSPTSRSSSTRRTPGSSAAPRTSRWSSPR